MISQIQPHFLFNTLTSICCLCRTAPEEAERAVLNFSSYLRGNIDSLSSIAPIPFTREMDHLNHYLEIEKMRFKDKLRIVYDLQADGFLLPSLTVQPIVENAVRHGVGRAPEGGSITISSRETETASLIIITDDGPGFDTQLPQEDGRVHVGIQNVRRRLQQQCGGDLQIESEPGGGTTVTMTIPKGWTGARI